MGCSSVYHKNSQLEEKKIVLKPYPEDINGINDKVANNFNAFLKNHGANPKPAYKERPKLNFEIKELWSSRRESYVITLPHSSENLIENNKFSSSDKLLLSSISEKKSAEDSLTKYDEKNFFKFIPIESLDIEPQKNKKPYKLSINFNIEDDINELKYMEDEDENIVSKYVIK
ncbi:hypothetical protein SteCoe_2035 [Stentor coeruleus]|uniref:Uncharacterized protein n=1 Tax=Stentor coeruleus TaxID=5963 RepID=A0A1R2D0A6_9CILI|nr:hypothetical protein SteCoe_2035 [Stentor coeruleus]